MLDVKKIIKIQFLFVRTLRSSKRDVYIEHVNIMWQELYI